MNRFNKVKQFKKTIQDATKGIDNCSKCRELRSQIISHAKNGHKD